MPRGAPYPEQGCPRGAEESSRRRIADLCRGKQRVSACTAALFDKSVNMRDSGSPLPEDEARWARLTAKQRACLDLLLERKTSKQIARILGIAKPTVDQRIATARAVLGVEDRDQAALRYAELKAIYDRVIHDPVGIPVPPRLVPSDFPDGDSAMLTALNDRASDIEGSSGSHPPFGDIWRPDHSPKTRAMLLAAMLVMAAFLILAGLAIGNALTTLIAG